MAKLDSSTLFGALLVFLGAFLLVQTLGLVTTAPAATWSVAFVLSGLAFLSMMLRGRREWWPLIPGFVLISIGILIGLEFFAPGVSRRWAGSIFLGLTGLAFVGVYIMRRSNWWAIIPGGTLLTLAVVARADQAVGRGGDGGPIFLAGLGLTFLAVYLAPGDRPRMPWALFPAGILLALAVVAGMGRNPAFAILWPLLLVVAGVYLVYRAMEGRRVHE